MLKEEMNQLAELIYFGHNSIELEHLAWFVGRQMDMSDPFTRRDWDEAAGLLEDASSWLEAFRNSWMTPNLLLAVRSRFVDQLLLLQAEGRISATRSMK
jgi:hypothetical protein